jgi:hypothetical protein
VGPAEGSGSVAEHVDEQLSPPPPPPPTATGSTDDDSGDGNEDGCSCYTHELAIPTPEDAPVKPAISAAARLVRGAALVLLVALAAVLGLSLARSTTQGGPWVPAAVADQGFAGEWALRCGLGFRRPARTNLPSVPPPSTPAGQRLKTLPLRMRGAGRRLAVPVPVPQRGLQGLPPVVDEDRPDASGVADATGNPSRPSRPQQQQQYNPTSPGEEGGHSTRTDDAACGVDGPAGLGAHCLSSKCSAWS